MMAPTKAETRVAESETDRFSRRFWNEDHRLSTGIRPSQLNFNRNYDTFSGSRSSSSSSADAIPEGTLISKGVFVKRKNSIVL